MPDDGAYLWEWFWDLDSSRPDGMNGPQPITLRDIHDWSELTGTIIRPDEVAILRRMDAAYRSAAAVESADSQKRQQAEAQKGTK